MSTLFSKVNWIRLSSAAHALLPSLIGLLCPLSWAFPRFAPRQIIDSHDLFPFFVAPWSPPSTLPAYLSRYIQAGILWYLSSLSIVFWFPVWIYIALARTFIGYLFTRAVGWAIPPLFRHYSVYETTSGFGPMLLAYFLLVGTDELVDQLKIVRKSYIPLIPAATAIVFCWLENAPWTYGIVCLFVGGGRVLYSVANAFTKRGLSSSHPMMLDRSTSQPPSTRLILVTILLVLPTIFLSYQMKSWISSASSTHMPPSPFPSTPLLDILILSSPRPDVTLSTKVLGYTIASYLPFTNNQTTLSVFTHSAGHDAFNTTRYLLEGENVTFYADEGEYPGYHSGHYLDLAEAFRWESEKASQAEWVMLVEDDFPLCNAREKAWSYISQVMHILENGRAHGDAIPKRRGAFVGTGGSGLIIHKSLLPTMIHNLLGHASIKSPIPPNVIPRPPDLVMQDCLLGDDPLCPPKHDGGLVITSRLVMDHIGGMVSTNPNKAKNTDKWRCGWRHPFHGRPEVEVVVVD